MWRSSIGSCWVTPSAIPVGRIVTLWTGSASVEHVGEHGVAALVVGDALLLLVGQDQALAALAHEHPVAGRLEVEHRDGGAAAAHRVQRRLVDQVGQVGAAHARGAAGDQLEVDVGAHPLVLAVDLEDRQPLVEVGERDHDLAVEAARAAAGPGPRCRAGWWRRS